MDPASTLDRTRLLSRLLPNVEPPAPASPPPSPPPSPRPPAELDAGAPAWAADMELRQGELEVAWALRYTVFATLGAAAEGDAPPGVAEPAAWAAETLDGAARAAAAAVADTMLGTVGGFVQGALRVATSSLKAEPGMVSAWSQKPLAGTVLCVQAIREAPDGETTEELLVEGRFKGVTAPQAAAVLEAFLAVAQWRTAVESKVASMSHGDTADEKAAPELAKELRDHKRGRVALNNFCLAWIHSARLMQALGE